MNAKNLTLIIISIFLIIALPISALAVSGLLNNTKNSATTVSSSSSVSYTNSNAMNSSTSTSKATTTVSKTTSAANTISLTEVRKHDSAGNCYVAVSGKVYNLSNFQHPSRDDFTSLCGMDITNEQHPRASAFTSSKVLSYISRYYIGVLGN